MRILRNYILKECLQPFTLSISVLTSVFLLGYLPQLANKVINNGVSVGAMGHIFLYYIPILLGYTLPIACLITVILAFGHMSSENEILAIRASGIHLLRLLVPLIVVGIILCLADYILNDRVIPNAYVAQKVILQETGSQDPTAMLEPGSFINAFDKYIVFIYRMEGDILYGIRIYEPVPGKPTRTIIAQQGEFVHVPGKDQLMLKLINGTSDEPDLQNPNNFYKLNFQTSFITLDLSKKKQGQKKSKELTLKELRHKIEALRKMSIDPAPLITEYQRRLAWSLSPLLFILLGFPFAAVTNRRAKSANLLYALLLAAPYYILSLACQGMATQDTFNPAFLMWVPDIVAFAAAVFLNWKLCLH
ncbi:MAG: LptF/LptG family permease [Candidatus Omnitrophica bacterium]|nr:LptF/LptG family permease [Candidatus Omnitrophota bacterium]MDE2231420.1 LptF/LptG family permease [Candidatus Omnitrophota bacterium]